ncbi:MAG: SRPBCC family protein [Flavobacteriales bacterium]|nr:SRPBCC family protein [Flavobacteriales bacterium]
MYTLERTQFLPTDLDTAWNFFSMPHNLNKITPEHMNFRIIRSTVQHAIKEKDEIDYQVKPMFGISMRWKTLITDVNPPYLFVDKQLKGPYRYWEHTHRFTQTENGLLMHDNVEYDLPLGRFGRIFHPLIRKQLETIFDYRQYQLNRLFNG